MEQAILNLSKVVGNFVEEQKGINVQLAQRIDTVESTLNKRIDGLESNLNQNWALLSPLWDPPFRYMEYSGRRRSLEAAFEKKADMWL